MYNESKVHSLSYSEVIWYQDLFSILNKLPSLKYWLEYHKWAELTI